MTLLQTSWELSNDRSVKLDWMDQPGSSQQQTYRTQTTGSQVSTIMYAPPSFISQGGTPTASSSEWQSKFEIHTSTSFFLHTSVRSQTDVLVLRCRFLFAQKKFSNRFSVCHAGLPEPCQRPRHAAPLPRLSLQGQRLPSKYLLMSMHVNLIRHRLLPVRWTREQTAHMLL